MYKVNDKEFNYNSYINQKIKDRLVREEVCGNVTDVVEFIISASNYEHMIGTEAPFNHDDIVNMYIDHQNEIDELDKYKEEFEVWAYGLEDEIVELEKQLEELENEYNNDPSHSELIHEMEELEKVIKEKINELISYKSNIGGLEDKIYDLESENGDYREVLCWYQVSPWLCDKLEKQGEVVIPHMNYWGRQTFGQMISMDYVINEICYDLQILEGQEYSWENKVK